MCTLVELDTSLSVTMISIPERGPRMETQGPTYTEQPPGSSVVKEAKLGNQTEGKSVSK